MLTQYARAYLQAGHHLLALAGKRPSSIFHHESWSWEDSIHGAPETDDDERALDAVFAHPTTTGIAILIPQHMLVADVDSDAAAALYRELAGSFPEGTPVAMTRHGLHVWFLAPGADASVWLGKADDPRILLFKGFGGYVVAPPSAFAKDDPGCQKVHLDTSIYRWLQPLDGGIEFLSDGIAAALAARRQAEGSKPVSPYADDPASTLVPVVTGDGPWSWFGGTLSWRVEWNTSGLEKAIVNAAEGNQNNVIHWAACTARDEGVPFEVAMDRLLAASVTGHHPAERAKDTIRGAYKRRAR